MSQNLSSAAVVIGALRVGGDIPLPITYYEPHDINVPD